MPAAALGLMPLGSVWQENRSERQIVLTTRTFDIDHAAPVYAHLRRICAESLRPEGVTTLLPLDEAPVRVGGSTG